MNKGINVSTLVSEFNLTVIGATDNPILYPGSLKKHDKNSILWTKNIDNLNQIISFCILI